jgi:adenylate kinase
LERGKATGRTDDTAEVVARRAKTFRNQSMPVVEALEGRGLLRRIDGSGDVEAVSALASAAFEPFAKS